MNLRRNGHTNTGCDCLNLYQREAHLPHPADCEAESPLLTLGRGLGRACRLAVVEKALHVRTRSCGKCD